MGGEGSGRPAADMIRLDGLAIKDGEITKSNYFNFLNLPLGDYSQFVMTADEALRFRNHVLRMKIGTSSMIPMLCSGPNCPVKQCPFHQTSNWPLTKPCIVEDNIIRAMTKSYVEDLAIDPDSPTEMILINKLVECDIIDYRANAGLSGGRDFEAQTLLKTTIMTSEHGTVEQVNVHPLLDVKEKFHRIRMNILEALAATRKEKYKKAAALKKREDYGASRQLSDLREVFEKATLAVKGNHTFEKIIEDVKKATQIDTIEGIEDTDWEEK